MVWGCYIWTKASMHNSKGGRKDFSVASTALNLSMQESVICMRVQKEVVPFVEGSTCHWRHEIHAYFDELILD